MKNFLRVGLCLLCVTAAMPSKADLFSAADGAFSVDMPAGWVRLQNPPQKSVLSVQKEQARIDIKTTDCTDESCLESAINHDLAEVKTKKMSVVKNTYTDEEIKHFEFSTGEPFYYIHFYTPKNDFSAGYFLANGKGYSILAKNITYAQADLIFSAIAPASKPIGQLTPPADSDVSTSLPDYQTTALPDVEVESLEDLSAEILPAQGSVEQPSVAKKATPSTLRKIARKLRARLSRTPIHTLVSRNMPPYIRELGHGYDILMLLIALFFATWCAAGIVRLFVAPRRVETTANPNSLYPIKLERRYGTPSLIFRAKDNQGNILTSLSARWDALFMFSGIVLMLIALVTMAFTSVCEQMQLLRISASAYNTLYSACALVLPLGFLILFCGIVWGQVLRNEITLFDSKGEKAAFLFQKGYNITREQYQIYFVQSKELVLAQRKRFTPKRQWKLLTKDGVELASFTERSLWQAIVRMFCGHLWGMLRADYDIVGAMQSKGAIENTHALFNRSTCNVDKPEAINARDLLAISLLISIRDRDKWYPWFN